MGTAIKLPVLDRVKPSFVIFDIRALWSFIYVEVSAMHTLHTYQWQINKSPHYSMVITLLYGQWHGSGVINKQGTTRDAVTAIDVKAKAKAKDGHSRPRPRTWPSRPTT